MIFWARPRFEWHLRTRTLRLGEATRIMALVNLLPGGVTGEERRPAAWAKVAVAQAVDAVDEGADIVDLGTHEDLRQDRTGAENGTDGEEPPVSPRQEQARLLPVLEAVLMARPEAVIAVEAYHAETARAAVVAGAEIVHDLSGPDWDGAMAEVVLQTGCGLVLRPARDREPGSGRESRGAMFAEPPVRWPRAGARGAVGLRADGLGAEALGVVGLRADGQRAAGQRARFEGFGRAGAGDAIIPAVFTNLCERLMLAEAAGIETEQIVADPGFGMGREGAEDFALLAGLGRLRQLGRPLLLGIQLQPSATLAGNVAAVLAGAHLLRVHDVPAARAAAEVADAVLQAGEDEMKL